MSYTRQPSADPAASLLGWFTPRRIGFIIAILAAFVFFKMFAFSTPAGFVDVITRFGEATRVVDPGLNFKIPFIESRHSIETRDVTYEKTYESASREPMELDVTVAINWKLNRAHVMQLYNQYGTLDQFEARIIAPRLPDAIKAVVSQFYVNELLTKRNELRDKARDATFGVIPQDIMTITAFAVKNVKFPAAYTHQIAAVQVAREAANEQEQVLRKQNYKAQEQYNIAKAAADSTKAHADATAYATLKNAEAEALSIALKGKANLDNQDRQANILKGAPILVDWERATKLEPGVLPSTFIGNDNAAGLIFQLGTSTPNSKK